VKEGSSPEVMNGHVKDKHKPFTAEARRRREKENALRLRVSAVKNKK